MLDSYSKTIQTLGNIYKQDGENGVIKTANKMQVEISSGMMQEIIAHANASKSPYDAPQSLVIAGRGETVDGRVSDIVGDICGRFFPSI